MVMRAAAFDPTELLHRAFWLQQDMRDDARRASMLRAIAAALSDARDRIIAVASAETALTPDELAPEFSRMTRTLEVFAGVVEDGRWTRDSHTPAAANPNDAIGPNHDLRSRLVPLRGVVVVFGASNFPLAYGVCGGDTASALAAGCPVVVKEHPAHRATGRLIADTARAAIKAAGFDPDVLGYIEDDGTNSAELAKHLIEHWAVAAVGFTGSLAVGTALHRLGANRERPIPVFAEMGSVNPSVIFPAALASRGDAIIDQLAASITQRFGQQCTCPGIIFLHSNRDGRSFAEKLAAKLAQTPPRRMLSPSVASGFERAVTIVAGARDVTRVGNPTPGGPVVLHCVGSEALAQFETVLATEMFGPGVLVVDDAGYDGDSMEFPGSLTMSIWFDPDSPDDVAAARRFLDNGRFGAGRIIFNGIPTGVRVCESMTHGGPWPATNRPDSTAVGPRAIERWCRWVSWQNTPSEFSAFDDRPHDF
ncbi:MAG: aldehyde dehydrogenase family protein [Phycisphaerales bacterium]|nr:aldehyde dehydrogenase family protein [Phycisphaerales bacterium]